MDEGSIFVAKTDCQAVDLQLANKPRRCIRQTSIDTITPRREFVEIHRVVQAGHGNAVGDRCKGGPWTSNHLGGTNHRCRRRIVDERWISRLDDAKFAHQLVVLAVSNLRSIVTVVAIVVIANLIAQLLGTLARIAHRASVRGQITRTQGLGAKRETGGDRLILHPPTHLGGDSMDSIRHRWGMGTQPALWRH